MAFTAMHHIFDIVFYVLYISLFNVILFYIFILLNIAYIELESPHSYPPWGAICIFVYHSWPALAKINVCSPRTFRPGVGDVRSWVVVRALAPSTAANYMKPRSKSNGNIPGAQH